MQGSSIVSNKSSVSVYVETYIFEFIVTDGEM